MKKLLFAVLIALTGCGTNDVIYPCGEYQINLEPDSIYVMDRARVVAVLPYSRIGALDSVFVDDNE